MEPNFKNFDRNIERMMNEHEVTPPFGMWNRIAADLEAEVAPVSVSTKTPVPLNSIYKFAAGALFISASLIIALLTNNSSSVTNPIITPTGNSVTESKQVVLQVSSAVVPMAVASKKKSVGNKSTKSKNIVKHTTLTHSNQSVKVSAPITLETKIISPAQSFSVGNISEPYYITPVAVTTNAPSSAKEEELSAAVSTIKTQKAVEKDDREVSDYSRIKFRPKKHRSFTYGRIIHYRKK